MPGYAHRDGAEHAYQQDGVALSTDISTLIPTEKAVDWLGLDDGLFEVDIDNY